MLRAEPGLLIGVAEVGPAAAVLDLAAPVAGVVHALSLVQAAALDGAPRIQVKGLAAAGLVVAGRMADHDGVGVYGKRGSCCAYCVRSGVRTGIGMVLEWTQGGGKDGLVEVGGGIVCVGSGGPNRIGWRQEAYVRLRASKRAQRYMQGKHQGTAERMAVRLNCDVALIECDCVCMHA